jgi:miniconductance mechanosensitive channel
MEKYLEFIKNIDYAQKSIDIGIDIFLFIGICIIAFIANFITKNFILRAIRHIIKKSKTSWDDILIERKVLRRLSHLAPALIFYFLIPIAFKGNETVKIVSHRLASIYMLIVGLITIDAFLSAVQDIYTKFEVSKKIPIRSFIQVIKVILYFLSAVIVISMLVGKSPAFLIGSLGAMAAILMLVFKDPILSFAAGIQLSSNNMVQIGDWIEMPKYGVDGDVIDISLTTVKVQNFDKTIVTIPPYAMVADSFKNWRGMSESGGRRIKRAINIDISSIKFCDEEMLDRFRKIKHISNYIDTKKKELSEFNKKLNIDDSDLVNGRRMTNVGTFRAYVVAYLREHPKISKNLTFLVRQLNPGPDGLLLEIYVFCNDTNWVNYEGIQADIFDHILAIIPEFGLKVFQNPTGSDFRSAIVKS